MRYTRSGLGLVPPKESEFNYKYLPSGTSSEVSSLFSSEHKLIAGSDGAGIFESPLSFKNLHTDERYNLDTSNIISQLGNISSMKLKYSDFVYCRNYGVYPNNRLIVVRRFGGPVGDNLTGRGTSPIGTLITWFDDQNPPISIDFGIQWEDAEVSFKNVLNNVGNDIGLKNMPLGDLAGGGFGVISAPGAFEPFTRQIFEKAGLIGPGGANFIPAGSPTLIKQAKQRKLIPDDTSGSSLNGKISVTVKCAWEQKFIGGIDPTKVYYDLLRMILHFGSDDASFYLGSGSTINSVLNNILKTLENPAGFIKQILEGFSKAFTGIITDIKKAINKFYDSSVIQNDTSSGENPPSNSDKKKGDDNDKNSTKSKQTIADNELNEKNRNQVLANVNSLVSLFSDLTAGIGRKYKHVLLGIGNSLSGAPSTPWHVTVGNPFRPILSSGDMYIESDIKLILGPTLAFNDLPSYIEVEFTLTSARNLGANEIFRKLHTGEVRISSRQKKTFYVEEEESDVVPGRGPDTGVPPTSSKDESTQFPIEASVLNKTIVGSTNPTGTTGSNGSTINSDPNSALPAALPPSGSTVETVTPPITNAQEIRLNSTSPTLTGTSPTSVEPPSPPAEGSVAQKIQSETPPAQNETSTQPVQEPANQTNEWASGEIVTRGAENYKGTDGTEYSVPWKIFKSTTPGVYEGRYNYPILNLKGGNRSNNIDDVIKLLKEEIFFDIDTTIIIIPEN